VDEDSFFFQTTFLGPIDFRFAKLGIDHDGTCCGWRFPRRAQFTLFAPNGDVLFHTTTREYKNAIKDVCNSIGREKRK
jgi:hypothetical protein